MIEGIQSGKGKYWKKELSGFWMTRHQTHTHTMSFCSPRLPSQHRTVPTSITEIPMHWPPRHDMPSPFMPTGYLFHKARGSAPPPCDCSLLPAGDPTLDQIACHFEHQCVRDFKCLTKLNEWHGTHHPKSHMHVPAIRACIIPSMNFTGIDTALRQDIQPSARGQEQYGVHAAITGDKIHRKRGSRI